MKVLAFILVSCFLLCLAKVAYAAEDSSPSDSPQADKPASSKSEANLLYMRGRQRVLEGKFEEAAEYLERAIKSDPKSAFIAHQLSEVYLRLGSLEKAETYAGMAVEEEPNNLEFRATFGGILASLKKYAQAKEHYAKILELEPSNQKAPLLLGILEAESGNMDQGINVLTKTLEDNPDNYMAYFYRAKIYLEMEQIKKAKADLDKCLNLKSNFVEAGTALGLLHERLGENEEAIAVYNRIQGNGRFRKRLAQLYLQKNDLDKALEELLEYEKVEPDDYTARVKTGLIYFELKQHKKALDRFQSILKEQPDADNVRFYMAAVYEELKQYDNAITHFKKLSKESTFYKEAMLHVGFILKEQGKMREGITFSKNLVESSPEIVEFYDMHASFFEFEKDYKKALAIIAEGLKRFPKDEKLLYFEGALFDKTGNRNRGVENMKKILEINPDNAHALNFLGYTYAEMNMKLDEAEKLITKALGLRPNDGYIEDSLGWVLFKKGKVDQALERLERANSLQPEEPIILDHLADAYLEKKDYAKASEYYKKALAASMKKEKDKEMAKKIEEKLAALQKEKRLPTGETEREKK